MSLGFYSQSEYESALNVRDKIQFRTAAAIVGVGESLNDIATAGGAYTITLPPVMEAAGRIFTFQKSDASTNACTLQDQNDSVDWADKTIDALADGIALFSDGRKWWVLTNDIA